ncbi:MAG: hypothetical protein K0Q72_1037, partial [Armatimonadetes bacterium]|nr:hypothetical protein [Armatimonadota bacterium]
MSAPFPGSENGTAVSAVSDRTPGRWARGGAWWLSLSLALALSLLTVNAGSAVPTGPGPSVATVSGTQLLVRRRLPDGTLSPPHSHVVRGIGYSPASRETSTWNEDPNNANVRRLEFPKWYPTDVPLIKATGANTVRLFMDPGVDGVLGTAGRAMLDEFYRAGIMVIMTVDDAVND